MRTAVVLLALTLSPLALAGELDAEHTTPPEQVRLSKDIPQTVVIRVSKTDHNQVAVMQSKKKIPVGTKVANGKFEQVAMNAERSSLPYNPKNELDTNSSTSSWFFGFGQASYWNRGGWGQRWGGYGYGRRAYYASNYYPYYNSGYYPYYSYAGYNYGYYPYWGYSDQYYDYSYCDWYY